MTKRSCSFDRVALLHAYDIVNDVSNLTYFPAIILLSALSGCVAASEKLSGLDQENSMSFHAFPWNDIHIGVTTKEDVRSLLGNPTDVQVSSKDESTQESWSYVSTYAARQPFQYVLLLGALAISKHTARATFAVSFSQEGIVDGLTAPQIHAQGHESYDPYSFDSTTPIPTYGMNNPLAQDIRSEAVSESSN